MVCLHGSIELLNFIKVPDNFHIVHFGRDDRSLSSCFEQKSETSNFKYFYFMYLIVSIWFFYIYLILQKLNSNSNSATPIDLIDLIDLIHENYNFFEIIKNKMKSILEKYTTKPKKNSARTDIGKDVYYYYPGDIIPDLTLSGNKTPETGLLVGITDIFTYHKMSSESHKKHQNYFGIHQKHFFDFPQESIYSDLKKKIDKTNDIYPLKKGHNKTKLSSIINEMVKIKDEIKCKKPTVLFIISCRTINTNLLKTNGQIHYNLKLLRLKREKSFLFSEIHEWFKKQLEKYNNINWDKVYKKKIKIKKLISDTINIDPFTVFITNEYKELANVLFTNFCFGIKQDTSNAFMYYEDYLLLPQKIRDHQNYNGTLLGLHLPMRDKDGQIFRNPDPDPDPGQASQTASRKFCWNSRYQRVLLARQQSRKNFTSLYDT